MQKKGLLALLLAAALMLSGCALIEKDMDVDRAATVVTVGDTTYTKGDVLDSVNYNLNYQAYIYSMYGQSFDPTSKENVKAAREGVVQSMIEQAVKDAKIKEMGFDVFTEDEEAEFTAKAEEQYASDFDSVKTAQFADSELKDAELDAAVEAYLNDNYMETKDTIAESLRSSKCQERLREYAIKDVSLSEEEIQAGFDAKVEDAKASYESSLSGYGAAVNAGRTVYYRPAGYRLVKQILIQFTDEDQAAITDLKSKRSDANTIVSNMKTSLTNSGVDNVDELLTYVTVQLVEGDEPTCNTTTSFPDGTDAETISQVQQLAEAQEKVVYYDQKISDATVKAYEDIDDAADAVITRLDAGEDFDAVMAETTQDPGMQGDAETAKTGYAVCENFSNFDTAFTKAAMALENIGDVSAKTKGASNGYYIIKYVGDVEEGPVALEDVKEELSASLLSDKQDSTYDDALAVWVKEANPKVNWKKIEK